MIRILNVEPAGYAEEARRILRGLGEVVERAVSRAELLRELPDYDVLIVRLGHRVDREVLDAGRRLTAVVTATTGLDHVDVDYAARRGIAVLSLAGETEFLRTVHATAEHTWALLLALLRRIPEAFQAARAGRWDRDRFRGRELAGRRLGLLGFGRLGQRVARYGLAFDMAVAAYDPYAREWPEGVRRVASLPELLARSDVLSIHVPLTRETRGLVGRVELAQLPQGAVLVNTARGDVVDPDALLWALEAGHLAGAALDVLPGEDVLAGVGAEPGGAVAVPAHGTGSGLRGGGGGAARPAEPARSRREGPQADRPGEPASGGRAAGEPAAEASRGARLVAYARTHENLLLTPHLGGATEESMARTEAFMARKLAAFLGARQPGRAGAGARAGEGEA